ncbi:hypothetical protein LQW54_012673 [Pestalotiopsis sp. IQ-011]
MADDGKHNVAELLLDNNGVVQRIARSFFYGKEGTLQGIAALHDRLGLHVPFELAVPILNGDSSERRAYNAELMDF